MLLPFKGRDEVLALFCSVTPGKPLLLRTTTPANSAPAEGIRTKGLPQVLLRTLLVLDFVNNLFILSKSRYKLKPCEYYASP